MAIKLLGNWECLEDITYYYPEEDCRKLTFKKGKTYRCVDSKNKSIRLENELGTTTGFNRDTFPGGRFRLR